MPERANPDHPIWQKRWGLFSTPALSYLRRRYRFCRPFVNDRFVLEVPCGSGMGAPYLRKSRRLVGLDYDQSAIMYASDHYREFYSDLVTGDMRQLPFDDASYEVVVCLEGIEHITRFNGIQFLNEVNRILTKQGVLLLSCPLVEDGIHSGNKYHLYEWMQEELLQEVKKRFQDIQKWTLKGPAGKVIMIAAEKKRNIVLLKSEETKRYAISLSQVSHWVKEHWESSLAQYANREKPSLLSTCFAILSEDLYETLQQWEEEKRAQVVNEILKRQIPSTGLFAPAEIKQQDLMWPNGCDLQYVQYQLTYFALAALTALQEKPKYPLSFAERFADVDYTIGWIDGGPWHNPWNHSNRIMFVLRYLVHLALDWGCEKAWNSYDAVVQYLLDRQRPESGLWHGFANCDVRTAVYAAYHFFPFMFWRGVCPAYAEQIIDSTLSIQSSEGLFGRNIGGGACEDLDAIDILVKFSLVTDYRENEVKNSLFRAFDRLLQLQNEDGGFPNYLPTSQPQKTLKRRLGEVFGLDVILNRPYTPSVEPYYYSGWRRIKGIKGHSDMWAAWFRPLALSLIVSRYTELGELSRASKFHALPGLGWHNSDSIRESKTYKY